MLISNIIRSTPPKQNKTILQIKDRKGRKKHIFFAQTFIFIYLCRRQAAPQQFEASFIAFGLHCLCKIQSAPSTHPCPAAGRKEKTTKHKNPFTTI